MSHERPREVRSLYGSDAPPAVQRASLTSGAVPVAVYGLGKMGLPLAAVLAETTGNVTGVDIDPAVVERVSAGESPVDGEPGLPELVSELVAAGDLRATSDPVAAASDASVHVVIVPTVLRGTDPDLSSLAAAVESIGAGLDPGDLVLVESTVPPGTCADVVEPTLAAESGLSTDAFGLAFCPERTKSGRALADIRGTHPKIVGGRDIESTRAARVVYEPVTSNDVLVAPDVTTAECVKVFEGVYRDVNIALANELARLADELAVDVNRAIDLANTQPFCDIHDPGVGVGGHCIPYYPFFLLSRLETPLPLTRRARGINDAMPSFAARTLVQELDERGVPADEARVLLLGLAYRPGVAETRKSPAGPLATVLSELGTTVYGTDPVLDESTAGEFDLTPVALEDVPELDLDGVVLVTAHPEFDGLDWGALEELVVVDGRDALDLSGTDHWVYTIGSGVTNG
ncbi:nucleotide sugar dehydrogenase [Salinirubellus salinus]|uniref:UDP-N-acetyl-D-mannosamine dehydrogenase n=1 Tax=Salinirubellus salinus TaxID=1364945 RepID=A0A9E7UAR8_9EURY|nr:nucleotide sugar dehydrogenase [Salinirubellus salinus]UWM54332.1 nucleotide sugar dehydrogenase [Salinirubellus salinus]